MRINGKGTNLNGEVVNGGIIGGHLCMECNVDGMTKEEADAHGKSKEHLRKITIRDRQFNELVEEQRQDGIMLNYLQEIDPL